MTVEKPNDTTIPPHHHQIDWKYLLVYGHLPSGMFTSSAKCRTGVRTLWQDLLTPILPIVGNPRVILIDSLRTQTHGLRWWYYLMHIELFFVIVHVISNTYGRFKAGAIILLHITKKQKESRPTFVNKVW